MPCVQTILHPTDFSDHSRAAFQTACAWARDHNARLILLHVLRPSVAPMYVEPPPDPLEPAESQGDLRPRLLWPQPTDPTLAVSHRLAQGDPAEGILRLARALPCDLIVMGTHGRTGLGRLLMGSVAEEIVRKAPCPVLTVKTQLPDTGTQPPAGTTREPLSAPAGSRR